MTKQEAENLFAEMTLRWLAARRDFPGLDVGPMPELESPSWTNEFRIRNRCQREFERSYV